MKRWLNLTLNVISLLLFGLILWWGGADAWQQLLNSQPMPLLIACLFYGAAGILSGWRLKLTAETVTQRPLAPWRRFYYVNMTARAFGLVLPRSLSTIGGKAVGLRALGVSMQRSVWVVIVDNLFDILFLGMLALPTLLFFKNRDAPWQFGFGALLATAVWLALLRWGVLTRWLGALLRWLSRFEKLFQRLKLDPTLVAADLPPPRPAVQLTLLTLFLSLTIAATYYFIAQAIGLSLIWALIGACFVITQLSLIVAVAPGGLGIFDLGWLGLLRLGGVAESDALNFIIAQRAFVFLFVLLWAGVSALLSLTVPLNNPSSEPLP